MMKKLSFVFLILFVALNANAQSSNQTRYGIFYIQNFAAQINYNPQILEDGKFQWNTLSTSGVGVFYERFISKRFSLVTQGAFQVKGYREISQHAEVFIPDSFRELEHTNKFRYATVEINPTYYFSNSEIIRPFFTAGLNGNYLINTQLRSDVYPFNNSYPVNQYDNFKQWSIGYNLGSGVTINNLLTIEGKLQKDITPILNTETLRVWNWVWSLNFKVNVNQIITDIKREK